MIGRIAWITALVWFACVSSAFAHEIRPAYLQIDEWSPGSYDVLWKVPSRGGTVLDIQPQFDSRLTLSEAGDAVLLDGFVVYRYRLTGGLDLPGTEITIRNLAKTTVDVLANLNLLGGERHTFLDRRRNVL